MNRYKQLVQNTTIIIFLLGLNNRGQAFDLRFTELPCHINLTIESMDDKDTIQAQIQDAFIDFFASMDSNANFSQIVEYLENVDRLSISELHFKDEQARKDFDKQQATNQKKYGENICSNKLKDSTLFTFKHILNRNNISESNHKLMNEMTCKCPKKLRFFAVICFFNYLKTLN